MTFKDICLLILFVAASTTSVWAGAYKDSAHGDTTNGVNRSVMYNKGYAIGNCAHCHEMHASLEANEPAPVAGSPSPFTVFATNFDPLATSPYQESDNFCFYCHNDSGSVQQVENKDFSEVFGCASSNIYSVLDAFNQLSYHNLSDIWTFAKGKFSWFYEQSNPCDACHNPHLVKRNFAAPADPAMSVLSKPSEHFSLIGDESTELMSKYNYEAPYCSSTTREPAGLGAGDGSDMPDYATYCTDCHQYDGISSTNLSRNLYVIDWSSNGDKHGARNADGELQLELPFSASGYVLSCMDCHEPHGSQNVVLIRRRVNGGDLGLDITSIETTDWARLCTRCHKDDDDSNQGGPFEWKYIHHYSDGAPYQNPWKCVRCHGGKPSENPIPCNYCHFHGGTDAWANTHAPEYPGNNITF